MKTFAQKHPVITFLLINFIWTWAFWFVAIPFQDQTLLVSTIVLIGGYGPAIGGILTIGLQSPQQPFLSPRRAAFLVGISALLFSVLSLRYLVGNVPGFDILAADLSLSPPVLLATLAACLLGGWVFSSAVSDNPKVRGCMASTMPWRLPPVWTIFVVVFYPVMILAAWGLASIFGMNVQFPGLWELPGLEILPMYILTFIVTLLMQGGNEELGWRGFMQPELQKKFSPLVAALIVSVFWSLWHLPLFLNGVYDADLVLGMLSGAIYRIPLAIFLAWFYNRSGGNLFLTMFLHASFNRTPSLLPTPSLILMALCLGAAALMVVNDKMWRKLPQG